MTVQFSVLVGGLHVPLHECDWIRRAPCGCATAICSARIAGAVLATEDDAWHEFYEDAGTKRHREAAIRAAKKAGFTVEMNTVHNAVTALMTPCTHGKAAPAQPDPTDPFNEDQP
ncbi:hypothetical protein B4N89_27310 [Embleya scabrispora]|uniref:Uncharacterized protein n=1 Tax=Embleya scabrispora TaxID=159449 RepID=A0A1T3P5I0_9ACTN|nr:hypothetical protein [Embleya scabrispora]OPC84140.1 hypothetical protein B4N89_27310 [Embleya scabrispora]